jgi:biofilm PGA synthesis N-glycosyltransferase PgaC
MILLAFLFFALLSIFVAVPVAYFLRMKRIKSKPWRLKIDKTYLPSVSIIVPLHNEEKIVDLKIKNLLRLDYPKSKTEIIFVDDASDDKTKEILLRVESIETNSLIRVLEAKTHIGKSAALNLALKHATGEVVIISDADCFWSRDILKLALPYLADQGVGAVTGREILLNPKTSWVTKGETSYNSFVQTIRLGESKVYSSIIFQGGFAAYKRSCLEAFDLENDDSGTALNIVQTKHRTLIIPELVFYTVFPSGWKSMFTIKTRRATQLLRIWSRCFRLNLTQELVLPKRIFLPEVFLHFVNPILFLGLICCFILNLSFQPMFIAFLLFLLPVLLIPRGRLLLNELVQSQIILLIAMFSSASNKQFNLWQTTSESRSILKSELLKERDLI